MTERTLHRHCTPTSFLPCLLSFSVCPQTDTAQLYNTQSDLCMRTAHLDPTGLLSSIMFAEIIVIFMTSHMVVDTSLAFLQRKGKEVYSLFCAKNYPNILRLQGNLQRMKIWNQWLYRQNFLLLLLLLRLMPKYKKTC